MNHTPHRVRSGDVELHVVEAGERSRPPVLLLHGFPDCHEVYSLVLDELARDFHVAAFDLRGAGKSTAPKERAGYRIANVLPDLTAVIDAVFGRDARVHLVAHDWGSVLAFSYVAEGRDRHRVASLTSVSGPHVRLMLDAALRNARSGGFVGAVGQLAASWYVFAMHLPRLPEALFRNRGAKVVRRALVEGGVPADDAYLAMSDDDARARTLGTMNLYRENVLTPPPMPARSSITVPIRLVVPTRDPFVRPSSFTNLRDYATNVVVEEIDASHWLPRSHPRALVDAVRAQIAATDARTSGSPRAS